jgi:hypothetical protein
MILCCCWWFAKNMQKVYKFSFSFFNSIKLFSFFQLVASGWIIYFIFDCQNSCILYALTVACGQGNGLLFNGLWQTILLVMVLSGTYFFDIMFCLVFRCCIFKMFNTKIKYKFAVPQDYSQFIPIWLSLRLYFH